MTRPYDLTIKPRAGSPRGRAAMRKAPMCGVCGRSDVLQRGGLYGAHRGSDGEPCEGSGTAPVMGLRPWEIPRASRREMGEGMEGSNGRGRA